MHTMPYIGSLGEQAAGFIDKDIANHQHHFENLLYADRLDEESKLWIGLHPISEPGDNQSISKLEPIAREYLLRGLGSNEHSFPVGISVLDSSSKKRFYLLPAACAQ